MKNNWESFFCQMNHYLNDLGRIIPPGGGAEDSYSAWHFFCVRIIQQKVTSHPVEN